MDDLNLDRLEKLALAFEMENDRWYNEYELSDGISYEPAANFILAVSPAAVLQLIELARRAQQGEGQAGELPELPKQPEELRARWKCEDCNGNGHTGEMIDNGYWQPPEPCRCSTCDGAGWVETAALLPEQAAEYGKACARAAVAARQAEPVDERVAFEAWAKTQSALSLRPSTVEGMGDYMDGHTQWLYDGWRARAAIKAAAPAAKDDARFRNLLEAARETMQMHDEVTGGNDYYGYISPKLRGAVADIDDVE